MNQESTPSQNNQEETQLQEQIAKLQMENERLTTALAYAVAENANLQKRAEEEKQKYQKFALEQFVKQWIPVMDSMHLGREIETTTLEALKTGIEMTLKQALDVLSQHHIKIINPLEETFNPNEHQSIGEEESPLESGRVTRVIQHGYLIHDRLLRPAMVYVSKKTPETP